MSLYKELNLTEGRAMITMKASEQDLFEVLQLQYLAYQSEAKLCDNPFIPPLTQTLAELTQEYQKGIILKVVEHNIIIGSIRACLVGNTAYVGKLIVNPDKQGQGIGSKLLAEIETYFPNKRYELFTSSKSERNIKLYQRIGYKIFKEKQISPQLKFVYLEK